MSSKIDQPPRYPTLVKPERNAGAVGTAQPQQLERPKAQQHSTTSPSGAKRHPSPQDLQKPLPPVFSILEMEQEDMEALKTVLADQVTFEITQLYSVVENISRDNNTLEVKQGLKALEEQIRLREYLHAKRTIIKEE